MPPSDLPQRSLTLSPSLAVHNLNVERVASSMGHVEISDLKYAVNGATRLMMKHKYSVTLSVDGQIFKTAALRPRNDLYITWNGMFQFKESDMSTLELQVFSRSYFGGKRVLGIREPLLQLVEEIEVTRDDPSVITSSNTELVPATISFTCRRKKVVAMENGQIAVALRSLLYAIESFLGNVAEAHEVYSYARIAWSILRTIDETSRAQFDLDERIACLVEDMTRTYNMVNDTIYLKNLSNNDVLKTLEYVARQTSECGYFIGDYCRRKSLWTGLMVKLRAEVEGKVAAYRTQFQTLQSALQSQTIMETDMTVLRIWNMLTDPPPLTRIDLYLQEMPYAKDASWRSDRQCLPGTRAAVITEICTWANTIDTYSPRMLLLTGVAGSGKSTIAHTVARRFSALGRLGSMFSFDITKATERHPSNVFSTIARDLASMNESWTRFLTPLINTPTGVVVTTPRKQFELILTPALSSDRADAKVITVGPIVIVIDAVDESGSHKDRALLLQILSRDTAKLPPNFRFLVTVRTEPNIGDSFVGQDHFHHLDLDDSRWHGSAMRDIATYIRTNLPDLQDNDVAWLTAKSHGLFLWAYAACCFLKKGKEDLYDLLDVLRKGRFEGSKREIIYSLYLTILEHTHHLHRPGLRPQFVEVMEWIIAARVPLSKVALQKLRRSSGVDGPKQSTVDVIVPFMGSLLSDGHEDGPICPVHTSFWEFLDAKFQLDGARSNRGLAIGAIQTMSHELRFNICRLKSSYVRNADVADVDERIHKHVSEALSYSSRFWADHLARLPYDAVLANSIESLLYSHALHWLELLSIIGEIGRVRPLLLSVLHWLSENNDKLQLLIRDIVKFVSEFGNAISESAPHIYLSALPFAPSASLISSMFRSKVPSTLSIEGGCSAHWPAPYLVLQGHTVRVSSVAFSPDGLYIASGSWDKTIRIWNAQTCELVAAPFVGHTAPILSVAFSPDGAQVASASGDKTIRVWDARTGAYIGGPLTGHTGLVQSVAFSPVGAHIISGSSDKTIRIWTPVAGEYVGEPLEGHAGTVFSVAYSPDGAYIASGSGDMTIKIWDAATRSPTGAPLEGHTGVVSSVAFSPDGHRIVSGSRDETVRVWDVNTRALIAGPFEGHSAAVISVAFSPNGQYIASGSGDETIRVWDATTGALVLDPFNENTGAVFSVAFSPDGTTIASGSSDATVRFWRMETGAGIADSTTDPVYFASSYWRAITSGTYSAGDMTPQMSYIQIQEDRDSITKTSEIVDGWVVTETGKLLFWVPPWVGVGAKLNLSGFVHGTSWHRCVEDR